MGSAGEVELVDVRLGCTNQACPALSSIPLSRKIAEQFNPLSGSGYRISWPQWVLPRICTHNQWHFG